MTLILFTENAETLAPLIDGITDRNLEISVVSDETELLRLVATAAVEAVIAEDSHLELLKSVIRRYPLINYALISSKTAEEFHTITEGYGFFTQIPASPTREDAQAMLDKLEKISSLSAPPQGVAS